MSGSRIRPYVGPIIALLIVLALGAGTAIAAIPNNGTYYACLVKDTGAVRLINYLKVKTCPRGERLIKWSAQGPAGPQGVQGVQGPAGPADWNAIGNKPPGFADGMDNDGVTAVRIRTVTSTTPTTICPGDIDCAYADCPTGFLAVGGGYTAGGSVRLNAFYSLAYDADTWGVCAYLPSTELSTTLLAEVICLRAEPAGLTVAAKNSDYGPKKPKVRLPDK